MSIALRHKNILDLIPEEPESISTERLLEKLFYRDIEIKLRMLQRDLKVLYDTERNIIFQKKGPNKLWSIEKGTKLTSTMTPSMALAFNMLAEYSKHLLPSSVNKQLQGQFNQAQRALSSSNLSTWQTRIATAPSGFQLHKAEIKSEVLAVVEEAIINQQQLEIGYLKRPNKNTLNKHNVEKRLINPLGLVIRGNVYYLVASRPDNEIRSFALHRMTRAQRSYNEVQFPDDFNLENYIKGGHLTFSSNRQVELELKVKRIPGYHLLETPLCSEQQVIDIDEQHFVIKATLNESAELHWWLMSIADISEVIAPKALRDVIIDSLQKAMRMYK